MGTSHALAAKGLFITWQRHQRTSQIGACTGIQVVEVTTHKRGAVRYGLLLWRTVYELLRRRPRWVLVQSPSYVLAAFSVTIGRIFVRRVIVDAHNEAVRPFIHDVWYVRFAARLIIRLATAVIITNDELARQVA